MAQNPLTETQKALLQKLVRYKNQGDLSEPFPVISVPHPKAYNRFILYLPLAYCDDVILNDEFFNPNLNDFDALAAAGFLGVQSGKNGQQLFSVEQSGIEAVDQASEKAIEMFEHILLDKDQEELLIKLVEASRNVPKANRIKFLVSTTYGGESLIHPGLQEGEEAVYFGDVEILANADLLNLGSGSDGSPIFDVSPLGFRYYDHLKQKLGGPVEQMEKSLRAYLDSDQFRNTYPNSYDKWSSAEALLWKSDGATELTTIGHLCREATQEFAEVLVNQFGLQDQYPDKARAVGRLKAVLDTKESDLGKTERRFLESLLSYWKNAIELIQRQEHGAQKEGSALVWEDGRRVVFNTMHAMYEVDKALGM